MTEYLYNTQVENISDCINGRFIVRVFDAEKTAKLHETSWRKTEKKYSYLMMDKLGRIFGEKFDSCSLGEPPRADGFFEIEAAGTKLLIDRDQNVICSDFYDIDEFSSNGVAVVEKPRGKRFLINLDGSIFSDEYVDYGPFVNGFAKVKLQNGKWSYIDEQGNLQACMFDTAKSFYNPNFAPITVQGENFVIDRNFKIVSGPYPNIMWIDEYNVVATMGRDENGATEYRYFTVDGVQLGPTAKFIHGFSDGISRVLTEDGYVFIRVEDGQQISQDKFKGAENFCGSMSTVFVGFDENGEHMFRFIRRDGTLSEIFSSASMVGENLGIAFVEGKNGKGGKFHYINENFELSKKGYSRTGSFSEGIAHYECKKDRYTYLRDTFERFEGDFDSCSRFSEGFGVVRQDGIYDAVSSAEILLSEISRFAHKITLNPLSFLELPEAFLKDPELVEELFTLASNVVAQNQDLTELELKDQLRRIAAAKQNMFEVAKAKHKKQRT